MFESGFAGHARRNFTFRVTADAVRDDDQGAFGARSTSSSDIQEMAKSSLFARTGPVRETTPIVMSME